MPEPGGVETNEKISVAYGKRIIGLENPQNMSKDEFERSNELLFHGAKEPFSYDPSFVYNKDFYTTYDGSLTLGTGFYTTPNMEQAKNYSYVRQVNPEGSSLNVESFLPNRAVMLDLRERETLQENAPISKDMFERWREKFVRYYKDQDLGSLPWYETAFLTEYLKHLDGLAKYPDIDLRPMLWTDTDKRLMDGSYPSPPWVDLFQQFMITEGYDGVIYIEGGEGEKGEPAPTYCFFNTKAIDTYEGWQKRASVTTKQK